MLSFLTQAQGGGARMSQWAGSKSPLSSFKKKKSSRVDGIRGSLAARLHGL